MGSSTHEFLFGVTNFCSAEWISVQRNEFLLQHRNSAWVNEMHLGRKKCVLPLSISLTQAEILITRWICVAQGGFLLGKRDKLRAKAQSCWQKIAQNSPETDTTPDISSDFERKYQQYQVNITLQKTERASKNRKEPIYSSRGRKISYSSTEG